MNNKKEWHKLDNTAKIFPVVSNKRLSNVFRISAILTEDINKDLLQKAVEVTVPHFTVFNVKPKRGFFWYYFDINEKMPIVKEESFYPCQYIKSRDNNGFLFKITYFKNKINLEVFHSVTDGTGAVDFFKSIIYSYLHLTKDININFNELPSYETTKDVEDNYIKNYKKKHVNLPISEKAFKVRGHILPLFVISVLHFTLNLKLLLEKCRSYHTTITEYLTATLMWSIYTVYIKNNKNTNINNIRIFVPVNLRKFFDSNTLMNFFSFITVHLDISKRDLDFDKILEFTKLEFKQNLLKENFIDKIANNVSTEKNLFVRFAPLFLKKIGGKIGYIESSKSHTTTLSNLGKIDISEKYLPYVENFSFMLAPAKDEPIKIALCSFKNKLVITFTSILSDPKIEKAFFDKLKEENLDVDLESNGVYYE